MTKTWLVYNERVVISDDKDVVEEQYLSVDDKGVPPWT